MKGWYTTAGYYGYLPSEGKYVLFATKEEYYEYYILHEEAEKEEK